MSGDVSDDGYINHLRLRQIIASHFASSENISVLLDILCHIGTRCLFGTKMALIPGQTTSLVTFHCGGSHQHMMIDIDLGPSVILPSVNEPLEDGDSQPYAERDNTIVHV